MQQTFKDALRERTEEHGGLFGVALSMFLNTLSGCLKENWSLVAAQRRSFTRVALATSIVLMVPASAMRFTDELRWDLADFAVAGALLAGSGLTYELVARRAGRRLTYRAAVGVAVAAALLLVWVNLAAGVIGHPAAPANLMYLGVLAVGGVGAVIARFQPRGMATTLVATAAAQVLVGVIALVAGLGDSGPAWPRDVVVATGIFAGLWVGSSLLFRHAGLSNPT